MKLGSIVMATKDIIEPDSLGNEVYNPNAINCQSGWLHARAGDLGTVIYREGDRTTVLFSKSSTLVGRGEVNLIK